jgi:glycosyltransferase involved in cell wall biosynthesis
VRSAAAIAIVCVEEVGIRRGSSNVAIIALPTAKNMPTKPLVSIIIPTHRPKHFRNALYCALAQSYENTEIIVSDNSGDSEIAQMCEAHPQVIYRKNSDGRPSSNIAMGLKLARGEFIKYLFDDDLMYPHCIASMLGWMSQFSLEIQANVGLITSARHLVNDDDIAYDELREPDLKSTTLIPGAVVKERILGRLMNFIGEFSTVLIRRSLLETSDPLSIFRAYGETFEIGLIDVPLYMSLMDKSDLLYIPQSLSAFRNHKDGGSNLESNPLFHMAVTDWLILVRAAYRFGALGHSTALAATRLQVGLNASFASVFPEAMAMAQVETQRFLLELESKS